jgi:putative ABC transport system ATP-binding protein
MSNNEKTIIIEARGLTREIAGSNGRLRTVDGVSFSFHRGEVYNIIGPSGAGKSSFLRLLNRLDEPTGGEVLFNGRLLSTYKPTELRKKVSMLFQTPYLFPGTVRDNIEYCLPGIGAEEMDTLMLRVGLKPEIALKESGGLSAGEKQRVALARSLVQGPEVLLLDEPTSALDPTSSRRIEQLILSLARDLTLTVIMVTHHPDQALRVGGYALLFVSGRLVESGRTEVVLNSPNSELGKKYIEKELT